MESPKSKNNVGPAGPTQLDILGLNVSDFPKGTTTQLGSGGEPGATIRLLTPRTKLRPSHAAALLQNGFLVCIYFDLQEKFTSLTDLFSRVFCTSLSQK